MSVFLVRSARPTRCWDLDPCSVGLNRVCGPGVYQDGCLPAARALRHGLTQPEPPVLDVWSSIMNHPARLLSLAAVLTLGAALAMPLSASAGGRPFTTTLSGANEVGGGDPDGSGTARSGSTPEPMSCATRSPS